MFKCQKARNTPEKSPGKYFHIENFFKIIFQVFFHLFLKQKKNLRWPVFQFNDRLAFKKKKVAKNTATNQQHRVEPGLGVSNSIMDSILASHPAAPGSIAVILKTFSVEILMMGVKFVEILVRRNFRRTVPNWSNRFQTG